MAVCKEDKLGWQSAQTSSMASHRRSFTRMTRATVRPTYRSHGIDVRSAHISINGSSILGPYSPLTQICIRVTPRCPVCSHDMLIETL